MHHDGLVERTAYGDFFFGRNTTVVQDQNLMVVYFLQLEIDTSIVRVSIL